VQWLRPTRCKRCTFAAIAPVALLAPLSSRDRNRRIEPDAQHRSLRQVDFLAFSRCGDTAAANDCAEHGTLDAAEDTAEDRAGASAGCDTTCLALEAFALTSKLEGIIPALESSHAIARVGDLAREVGKGGIVVLNLSGRGDKDIFTVANAMGETLHYRKMERALGRRHRAPASRQVIGLDVVRVDRRGLDPATRLPAVPGPDLWSCGFRPSGAPVPSSADRNPSLAAQAASQFGAATPADRHEPDAQRRCLVV